MADGGDGAGEGEGTDEVLAVEERLVADGGDGVAAGDGVGERELDLAPGDDDADERALEEVVGAVGGGGDGEVCAGAGYG